MVINVKKYLHKNHLYASNTLPSKPSFVPLMYCLLTIYLSFITRTNGSPNPNVKIDAIFLNISANIAFIMLTFKYEILSSDTKKIFLIDHTNNLFTKTPVITIVGAAAIKPGIKLAANSGSFDKISSKKYFFKISIKKKIITTKIKPNVN